MNRDICFAKHAVRDGVLSPAEREAFQKLERAFSNVSTSLNPSSAYKNYQRRLMEWLIVMGVE